MSTTLKSIDKRIAKFTTNRNALRLDAHEIGLLILRHAAPAEAGADCGGGKGDCTRALKLCEAMPKSWAEQMVAWFKAYSPIRVVVKNGKCEFSKEYKALAPEQKLEIWNIEGATETPFWEASDEPDAKPALDFAALCKLVEGLGKRIAKKVEDGEVKPEDMESAKAIAKQVSGLKLRRVKPANDTSTETGEKPAKKSKVA